MTTRQDDLDITTDNRSQQQASNPKLQVNDGPEASLHPEVDAIEQKVQTFKEELERQQQTIQDQINKAGEGENKNKLEETLRFIKDEKEQLAKTYKSLLHAFGDDLSLPDEAPLETLHKTSQKFDITYPKAHTVGEPVTFTSKYTLPNHPVPQFDVTPDSITYTGENFGPLEAKMMIEDFAALDKSMLEKSIDLVNENADGTTTDLMKVNPYQATLIAKAVEAHNIANPGRIITIKHGQPKKTKQYDQKAAQTWQAFKNGELGTLTPAPPPTTNENPSIDFDDETPEQPDASAKAEENEPTAVTDTVGKEDKNRDGIKDISPKDRDSLIAHRLIINPNSTAQIIEGNLDDLSIEGRQTAFAEMNATLDTARAIAISDLEKRNPEEIFSPKDADTYISNLNREGKQALFQRAKDQNKQESEQAANKEQTENVVDTAPTTSETPEETASADDNRRNTITPEAKQSLIEHESILFPDQNIDDIIERVHHYSNTVLKNKIGEMAERNATVSECVETVLTNNGDNNTSTFHIYNAFNELPAEHRSQLLQDPAKFQKKAADGKITSLHALFDSAGSGEISSAKVAAKRSTDKTAAPAAAHT